MSYQEKLKEIYTHKQNFNLSDVPEHISHHINNIANNCYSQKGVFTVIITLGLYKLFFPAQDIRQHQTNMEHGFSGRSFDTQYITPTLKEMGLPSMAESGWLTGSLEQPYPYNQNYAGKISGKGVKESFLALVDYIQHSDDAEKVIGILFNLIDHRMQQNIISIARIKEADNFTINDIIITLTKHFDEKYSVSGGAKLPVIAFYTLLHFVVKEMARYKGCYLGKLGSHTASDLTSKSAGDIEIYDENNILLEAFEIKHNKIIDPTVVRIAREKIHKYNPKRYYILSSLFTQSNDLDSVNLIVNQVKQEHGCSIIVNRLIPSIKYYLRLINNLDDFVNLYSNFVIADSELKNIHKETLKKIIENNHG